MAAADSFPQCHKYLISEYKPLGQRLGRRPSVEPALKFSLGIQCRSLSLWCVPTLSAATTTLGEDTGRKTLSQGWPNVVRRWASVEATSSGRAGSLTRIMDTSRIRTLTSVLNQVEVIHHAPDRCQWWWHVFCPHYIVGAVAMTNYGRPQKTLGSSILIYLAD